MKTLFFFLAIVAWIIGLTIHIVSFAGFDITDKTPNIPAVFASIFFLLIPTVITQQKNEKLKIFQQSTRNSINPFASFKIIFKETPGWLKVIAIASWFNAIINFILFMQLPLGSFDFKDGQHLLIDHGQVIKIMTEQEYHQYRADLVRVLSGCCLGFYGGSAAVLFPFTKKGKKDKV